MLIGRERETEKIEDFIKHRYSVLIFGINGIGKTTLLKEIKRRHREKTILIETPITPREILNEIIHFLGVEYKRSRRAQINEIIYKLKKCDEPLIILIDDFDQITTESRKVLRKIFPFSIFIVTSEKDSRFNLRQKIELEPLKRNESKILIKKILGEMTSENVIKLIATKSEGIPGKILEICKEYKIALELGEIKNKEDLHHFINKIKPVIWKRIDILTVPALSSIAYLFLVGKYFLYGINKFEEAFIVAIFGYATMAIARFLWIEREIEKGKKEEKWF